MAEEPNQSSEDRGQKTDVGSHTSEVGPQKTKLRLEIAHVLFIDIVGYSKLLIDEQSEALQELNQIVRKTEAAREAGSSGQLIILPTGDGMALVFTGSVEDPVECALQISHALRAQPSLPVRMGIHSGPVHHVVDVNNRENIAGAGINTAQRVMDCGDAGHILVSKRVADDLAQYRRWQPYLHDVGDIEVKHGVVVSVVNLYADVVGNPASPAKFKGGKTKSHRTASREGERRSPLLIALIVGLMLFTLIVLGIVFAPAILKQIGAGKTTGAARARESSGLPRGPGSPPPATTEKSIAVLPFDNLSEDKANAFFADGVQDEILTDLSKIADLKVISRSSVMHYKTGVERNLRKIGQELGVAHLLEGSVQRSGNRVRVNAQLIDARNDAHIWAQTYDRDLADVFAIQSDIAKAIAEQLQAKLSPNEQSAIARAPTRDLGAFDLYTRARNLILNISFTTLAGDNLHQAIDLLQQAIKRDGNFAGAYVSLADAYDQLYSVQADHTPEHLALAEAAIARLHEIAPDTGETHLAVARHRYYAFRDYNGARAELNDAARHLPNEPAILSLAGFIDRRAGKWNDSVRELDQAIERDPRNTLFMQQAAISYLNLRRFSEMAAVLDRALSVDPERIEPKIARAQVELHWRANTRPLHDEVRNAVARDPASASVVAENWINLACCERDADALGRAVAALGNHRFSLLTSVVTFDALFAEGLVNYLRKDSAGFKEELLRARANQEQSIREQPGYGPPICALGLIDAMLGDKEQALSEGRRAMELIPIEKDAVTGAELMVLFAAICAWSGDKNLALEQLAKTAASPSNISYGALKLHPVWDPLRGDPRFEKIVSDLAPK